MKQALLNGTILNPDSQKEMLVFVQIFEIQCHFETDTNLFHIKKLTNAHIIIHTTLLALCYSNMLQPSKDHLQVV